MFIRKDKLKEIMFNISKEIYKQCGRSLSIKDERRIKFVINNEINKSRGKKIWLNK